MTQIVFHIGFQKTASSWLQKQVFPRLNGVDYLNGSNRAKTIVENIVCGNPCLFSPDDTAEHLFNTSCSKA